MFLVIMALKPTLNIQKSSCCTKLDNDLEIISIQTDIMFLVIIDFKRVKHQQNPHEPQHQNVKYQTNNVVPNNVDFSECDTTVYTSIISMIMICV